jgi:hypothetical protein
MEIISLAANQTVLTEALAQWNLNQTGPLVNTGGNHIIWGRIPSDDKIWKQPGIVDPAAGEKTPHFELIIVVSTQP